jgi:phosphoglycolate phosphatase-like HAD superfamily hydrolase
MASIRIYDVFDTLVIDNSLDLLRQENPGLAELADKNYAAVRDKVKPYEDRFHKEGKVRTKALLGVQEALKRTREKGYAIGVYSSGDLEGIERMLRDGGIRDLVEFVFPVNNKGTEDNLSTFGMKEKPESFVRLAQYLNGKGLDVASFADDKAIFCAAAYQSGVVPAVYHVAPKPGTSPSGCIRIASIAEIG